MVQDTRFSRYGRCVAAHAASPAVAPLGQRRGLCAHNRFFALPRLVAGQALASCFGLGWCKCLHPVAVWRDRRGQFAQRFSPFQVLLCLLRSLVSASVVRGRFPLPLSRSSLRLFPLCSPGHPPVLRLAVPWGRIVSFSPLFRSPRSRVSRSLQRLAPAVAVPVRSPLSRPFLRLLVPVLPLPGGLAVVSVFRFGCALPVALLHWCVSSLTCPPVRRGPVLPLSCAFLRLASLVVLCSLVVLPLVSVFRSSCFVSVSLPFVCPGSVVVRGVSFRSRATLRYSGSRSH